MDMGAHFLARWSGTEHSDDWHLCRRPFRLIAMKRWIEWRRSGLVVIDTVQAHLERLHRCQDVMATPQSNLECSSNILAANEAKGESARAGQASEYHLAR